MDFVNNTDGQPLLWQKLRDDEAIFQPAFSYKVKSHPNQCQQNSQMDFYIHMQPDAIPLYVAWNRHLPRRTNRNNSLDYLEICYITSLDEPAFANLDGISHVFSHCLLYYGKILANNDSITTKEEKGK